MAETSYSSLRNKREYRLRFKRKKTWFTFEQIFPALYSMSRPFLVLLLAQVLTSRQFLMP